jgi:hypothetical protein
MKSKFTLLFCIQCFASVLAIAQAISPDVPQKVKALQEGYEAAILRAKEPITNTYIKELEKLKIEYTRVGDLAAAVVTEELIKTARESLPGSGSKGAKTLTDMNDRQFRKWLSTVVISEVASPQGIQYTTENDIIQTMWGDMKSPRVHQTATIEVGRLIVPFTNTVATIDIDASLTKAKVTYNNGTSYEAEISEKKRR